MRIFSKIVLLFAFVLTTSCRFDTKKSNSNRSKTKPQTKAFKVTEKPADSLLIGLWEVDAFSYKYFKEFMDIRDKKVTVELRKDGTVVGSNLPRFSVSNFEPPKELVSPSGTWFTNQSFSKENWQVTMRFDRKNDEPQYGFAGRYDIYKRNDSLLLWLFLGDPDSGDRLLFVKI